MIHDNDRQHFLEHGFLHVPAIIESEHLALLRNEFERVWEVEKPPVHQHKLLRHQAFIELIEHPPILQRQAAMFGRQVQLLQYDLLRQGPHSQAPERAWHRDFVFPGDNPLAINTIVYLDDTSDEVGPTFVVPGSQRGHANPAHDLHGRPLPNEVAAYAVAGDAVFINGAIWHSGGRNRGSGLRRAIYLYYGYWWLKRYNGAQPLPWQALVNASEQRLILLGLKMPAGDLHQYD